MRLVILVIILSLLACAPKSGVIEDMAEDGTLEISGEQFDGRCPICKYEKLRSTVRGGMGTCTLMNCVSYYDEDGKYIYNPCNTCTSFYSCSEGHEFTVESKR